MRPRLLAWAIAADNYKYLFLKQITRPTLADTGNKRSSRMKRLRRASQDVKRDARGPSSKAPRFRCHIDTTKGISLDECVSTLPCFATTTREVTGTGLPRATIPLFARRNTNTPLRLPPLFRFSRRCAGSLREPARSNQPRYSSATRSKPRPAPFTHSSTVAPRSGIIRQFW